MEGGEILILLTIPSALEKSECAVGEYNVFMRKHRCDNDICPSVIALCVGGLRWKS